MDRGDLSLRDLEVFLALLRLQSLTKTGRELDASQPAISRCLAKLREHFGDPLFVRAAEGMQPTPRALSLAAGAQQILNVYLDHMSEKRIFDPKRSGRTFHIAASEVGTVLVIDAILPVIQASSPGLRLCVVPLNFQALIHGLQSGDIDLVVGGFPQLHASIRQQLLFQETYNCLVRASHPFAKKAITPAEFLSANHLIVSAQGSGHAHSLAESALRKLLDPRGARVECYSFLAAAILAEKSDLIITVPSRTLGLLNSGTTLRALEPPIDLPSFAVRQYWHERFHDDEGHTWLRHTLAALLQSDKAGKHEPPSPTGRGAGSPERQRRKR
jgi:DNA-binding transcriptional LysR family regulator